MEVNVYKRRTGHPVDDLLRGITKSTTLVRVDQEDYIGPLWFKLDFEDRIICGKDDIMSNRDKVLGIIDIEISTLARPSFAKYLIRINTILITNNTFICLSKTTF